MKNIRCFDDSGISVCFPAADAPEGRKAAAADFHVRRLLNYSGLNFVAALLLSASYRCEREFVPQSIFTYLIPCNSPKGIVFSAYIDDMIKEYEDKRLKIEESIPVFFDNIIFLLKSMINKNLCYKNISIGPYTLKFVALVLFLGKYYE